MENFDSLVKELKSSPIYNMSLGSRELFHSNFLKWLFESYNSSVSNIFGKPTEGLKLRVETEEKHIDLIIEALDGEEIKWVIAVENKIKDTPKKTQLEKYDGELSKLYKDVKVKKYILSLVEPREEIQDTEWEFLSYGKLASKLGSLSTLEPKHQVIVDEYVSLIQNLSKIISSCKMQNNETFWFLEKAKEEEKDPSLINSLRQIKFLDTYRKYQASILFDELYKKTKSLAERESDELYEMLCCARNDTFYSLVMNNGLKEGGSKKFYKHYYNGLANKSPIVGMHFTRKIEDNLFLSLGVQVQGNQYRRYIEFNRLKLHKKGHYKVKSNQETIRTLASTVDEYKWFFGADRKSGDFDKYKPSENRTNLFCCYAPDNVYQYLTIGDLRNQLRPDEMIKKFPQDMLKAYELLNDEDYIRNFRNYTQRGSTIDI